ncbi:ATP-binding cassette domain-containing protein [Actinomadura sp. NPDC047616]|uniref:ATP-binding cassette domain-containing protein n=1 Tax=Actinomadura sp. NPDC047616 TaxID=3155914 RepID=UPI0033F2FF95
MTGIAAGLHAVLRLPPGTEASTVKAATWMGVAPDGLATFRHPDSPEPHRDGLVVGYATPPEHRYRPPGRGGPGRQHRGLDLARRGARWKPRAPAPSRGGVGRLARTSYWRRCAGTPGRPAAAPPDKGTHAGARPPAPGARGPALEDRYRRWSFERACTSARYPTELADLYPHQHSGGQIQRAALAAALLPEPRVLIADEPTASLDTETAYGVWATLRRYADAGAAVLVITHDVPMLTAAKIADHVALMHGGKVVATGGLTDLAALADPYVRGFFQPNGF